MAELEAELGATATYFLMTESVFYNLASSEGEAAIARLRELGHRVGLHAVYPRAELDERFDPVVAWHNPDPEYMRAPLEGAINVMQTPHFSPATYRSDSNQHWRSGCPHDELRAGAFPWLQLLDASGDLGLPGRDDGTDDARDARGRAGAAAGAARRRPDRPRLGGDVPCDRSPSSSPRAARRAPRPSLRGAARERRARASAWSERTCPSEPSAASLRRVPPRPAGRRPRLRGRLRDVCAPRGGGRASCRSPRSTSTVSRRARDRFAGAAVLVSTPDDDPPLERQGRTLRGPRTASASPRRRSCACGGASAVARRRARARLPGRARLLQAGRSRRARADSASSTRPSTARISS